MAAPKTTVWDIEPHTRAKHEILRRYLQAWIPILSQGGFPQVCYIDGFAGPGRYAGGEDGSPVIALRSALEHSADIKANVEFFFVEIRADRAENLDQVVSDFPLPRNFSVEVTKGQTFEQAFAQWRRRFADARKPWPATFAFIDPFGWSGVPFWIVKEILSNRSCEVLVTFMYEEINRFIGHRDQATNFEAFFGTEKWRSGAGSLRPQERNRFLHDLYVQQLREDARANPIYARGNNIY
jgi:three-Cys-motif partner protein